jgi:hypothetical protein
LPHHITPSVPNRINKPNQMMVSRTAGPSRRSSNSRIVSRGTGDWYQSASANPLSIASLVFSPTRL